MSDTAVRAQGRAGSPDASQAPLDAPPARDLAPAAERGSLDIRDRVVERVAEIAALEAPGAVRWSGALDKVTGRDLPRVDSTLAGDRVRVRLDVAVAWPTSLAENESAVRERVTRRVGELTGLTVDAVDVTATHVTVPARSGVPLAAEAGARPVAAARPRPYAPAARWGALLAVLAVAAGVVLAREALVLANAITGQEWLTPFVAGLAKAPSQGWALGAAIAAIVVGLLLLRAAVWPRRASHLAVGDDGVVWLRRRDLARLATQRASDVDGVVAAAATAGRRSVSVRVRTTTAQTDTVRAAVQSAVERSLAGLASAPSVSVSARPTEGASK